MNNEIQTKSLQTLESLLNRGIISTSELRTMLGLKAEKTSEYIIKDIEVAAAIINMMVEAGVEEHTAQNIVYKHAKDKRKGVSVLPGDTTVTDLADGGAAAKNAFTAMKDSAGWVDDEKSSDLTKQINESLAWITPANTETDADAELNAKIDARVREAIKANNVNPRKSDTDGLTVRDGTVTVKSANINNLNIKNMPVSCLERVSFDLDRWPKTIILSNPRGETQIPVHIGKDENGKVVVSYFRVFK